MRYERKRSREAGTSIVEMALILALVALMAIPSLGNIGHSAAEKFCQTGAVIGGNNTSNWNRVDGKCATATMGLPP